jgi:hypothetical protein
MVAGRHCQEMEYIIEMIPILIGRYGMISRRNFIIIIPFALVIIGLLLVSSVSAGGLDKNTISSAKSSTNKEILLPKEGLTSFKFPTGNLISLIVPQGNISPYYTVDPISPDKPDYEKQSYSITIALPTKPESISFGLYDKNMAAACCGGSPFRGRTDFIY